MKKIGIVTINDTNYGNRLQNYAVCNLVKSLSYEPENICIYENRKQYYLQKTINPVKKAMKTLLPTGLLSKLIELKQEKRKDRTEKNREGYFRSFTKKYIPTHEVHLYHDRSIYSLVDEKKYACFLAGSDQIWNPDFAGNDFYFLTFAPPEKRIAFTASIGYRNLPKDILDKYGNYWKEMKYISVRETSAARLVKSASGRTADVFFDSTLLLGREDWEQIVAKPQAELPREYIAAYFLGESHKRNVEEFAAQMGCEIVWLNDKNYPDYYVFGPSEFLYVIQNASGVLTDSFHAVVFSVVFHKPFYAFERSYNGNTEMFDRISEILTRMSLENRIWNERESADKEMWDISESVFEQADVIRKKEKERVLTIMAEVIGSI